MTGDSMSMAHQGHDGMHDDGGKGDSGGTPDCCDNQGCGCGCTAPQACVVTIADAASAPIQISAIALFPDGVPPIAELTAPFRPPA